jgi:hypothetical protein
VRSGPERTVLVGWDWKTSAISLVYGIVLVFPAVRWTGSLARGIALCIVASLVGAAGVGWRLVIDQDGFRYAPTWFGVPGAWRRYPIGSPVFVTGDEFALEETIDAECVRLGEEPRATEFARMPDAVALFEAIEQAVERHHGPRVPAAAVYR